MTTINEARIALAAAVTAGTGLRCSPYTLDKITTPSAQIDRSGFDPRMVFGNTKSVYRVRIRVYTNRNPEIDAQKALDAYSAMTGDQSITAAVADEANWNGEVDYAQVVFIGDTELVTIGRDDAVAEYLTVPFDVEVTF